MREPAIYLAHSGDTEYLVNVLVKNRVIVDWDGNPDKRMYLKMAQPNEQGQLVGLSVA